MNKLFKHTKKFMLVAMTLVMMLATSTVVFGANTSQSTLHVLKVSKAAVTLYANGSEADADVTGTNEPTAVMQAVPSSATLDVTATFKDKTAGDFNVKSSDVSVASVEKSADGKQIIITAVGNGKATIKLTDPNNAKKTAKVTVTVKSLVDTITFDSNVVEAETNNVYVGIGGSVTLGTTVNADASAKNVKYVIIDGDKKALTVNAKGVVTVKANAKEGLVKVCVVAQDQKYDYLNAKGKKLSKAWGENEIINIYVKAPSVLSAEVTNVALKNNDYDTKKNAKQTYEKVELKTNATSNKHSFKLQVNAYSEALHKGDKLANAVTFVSSNAKIATVDKNGVITGVKNGNATITVIPKDGVKLKGKEILTIPVTVTTDLETITVPGTEITAFAGANYKLTAKLNANVKGGKVSYEITNAEAFTEGPYKLTANDKKPTDNFMEYVKAKGKQWAKGTFRTDIEGIVDVKITATDAYGNKLTKDVTITFINPVTKITAKVPNFNVNKNDFLPAAATTLYLDRVATEGAAAVNDTCAITVDVTKKQNVSGTVTATTIEGITATSNKPEIADVKIVGDKFVVEAKAKGKAVITLAAQDGSKKTAKVTINVQQKVDEITVTNAALEGDVNAIYLAPNAQGITKTTFAATPNADANVKGLKYAFAVSEDFTNVATALEKDAAKLLKVTNANKTITLAKDDDVKAYLEENGKLLLGTLTVTATDNSNVKVTNTGATHVAKAVKVNVYAVAKDKYMAQSDLEAAVAAITGGKGLTLEAKQKLNIASLINIPADVTVRTVNLATADKKFVTVDKKGNITAAKVTTLGTGVNVTISMKGETTDATVVVPVRVIASQKDFNTALNNQITAVLKDNNYTWLGAKPTFNAGKATLTLAISDITMSKEDADAEMKAKLKEAMEVFQSAADAAIDGTASQYKSITITDAAAGKAWTIERAGFDIVVSGSGLEAPKAYDYLTEKNAALADLVDFISEDVDDIVEWANKKLSVTLTANNTAEGYAAHTYTTAYTVDITLKDADVEKFLDGKVSAATAAFAAANADLKAETGIQSVTYNADTNTTVVDICDNTLKIADVYAIVKDDAVAALEDIFTNAVKATVEVTAPGVESEVLTYERNANSDVNALVEKLYAKLCDKLLGDTTRELEGTAVYATVDFQFGAKTYTKTYTVAIKRTMEAIDANVDAQIYENLTSYYEYATVTYDADTNHATVAVKDGTLTLADALAAIKDVEAIMGAISGDVNAASATITSGDVTRAVVLAGQKISATDLLYTLKPEWETAEDVLAKQLGELVGTSATVSVEYIVDNDPAKKLALTYAVDFTLDHEFAESNIDYTVDGLVWAMADEVLKLDAIVAAADFSIEENIANIYVNNTKLDAYVEEIGATGLYSMFESVLNAAKSSNGKLAVISTTAGSAEVDLTAEITKADVAAKLMGVGINQIKDLIENPVKIAIVLTDDYTINYTVEFFATDAPGSELNPIRVMVGTFEQEFAAGQTGYYHGFGLNGMGLTVTGKDAIVMYDGEVYESGELITLAGEFGVPTAFEITNGGEAAATYTIAITYPVGSMENPEVVEDGYYTVELEAGNQGYYYNWVAQADGTLTFDISNTIGGWQYAINNTTQYVYGETHWSDDEEVVASETINVKAGDVISIMVGTYDATDMWATPEGSVSFMLTFAYPLGSELNPIMVYDLTFDAEIAAGAEVYYQGYFNGMSLTVAGENAYVLYNGTKYNAGEAIALASANPRMPVTFVIGNAGETEATYSAVVAYPAGHMENPAALEVGNYTQSAEVAAGTQGYYFEWTSDVNGTVTFDISETEGGWMYVINNMTTYKYGDTQWSDSEPVALTSDVDVAVGDVIQIVVNTYDPVNPWSAPAGTIEFTFNYKEGTELNPIMVYDSTFEATVAAGEEVYYGGYFNGMSLTVAGENAYVLYNGTKYNAGEAVALASANPRMPVTFVIGNAGETEATYSAVVAYPEGHMENPKVITAGTHSTVICEGTQGYFYTIKVPTAGEMVFDISATEDGWMYVINNMTTYQYGDTQWSDSEPVATTSKVAVAAGDVIQIIVNTYDPTNPWNAPAGTVDFTVSFEEVVEAE